MPIFIQAKSNYMNYSQFKKNGQSVLLYGNDSRGNNSFVLNSNNAYNNECQKYVPIVKPQENSKPDYSKIVMEGRGMANASSGHPKSHQEQRKHRSHHRCQWEAGKMRRKVANWNHKIPFCLDARCHNDTEPEVIKKHRIILQGGNSKQRNIEIKMNKPNFNIKFNQNLKQKISDNIRMGSKFRYILF